MTRVILVWMCFSLRRKVDDNCFQYSMVSTPSHRIQMLDMIRFLVVWNPLILTLLHFVFHWTGLERNSANHPLGGPMNATMPLIGDNNITTVSLSPVM